MVVAQAPAVVDEVEVEAPECLWAVLVVSADEEAELRPLRPA
jgi:hypothetical protein